MLGKIFTLLILQSFLLISSARPVAAQTPDGAVKITSRMVAPGIGLSWGEGVLTYHGREYPFEFKATGLFRDVDSKITAAELSGQVFNLKTPEDFAGNYQNVDTKAAKSGAASRATMKNQKGVVVNLASTIEGRKFNLSREGINIELKKQSSEKK